MEDIKKTDLTDLRPCNYCGANEVLSLGMCKECRDEFPREYQAKQKYENYENREI